MRSSAFPTIIAALGAACSSAGTQAAIDAGTAVQPDGGSDSEVDDACGAIAAPNAWPSWIMPNPVQSGLPNPASYTASPSGNRVTDDVTGLVWQRTLDSRSFTWDLAKEYCACLTIDGAGGWRLPSRIELVSIADWTRAHPSIDPGGFPSTPSENFWTSSVLNGDSSLGWLVFFDTGFASYAEKGYMYRARCVSSGAAPSGRYAIANGTVHDTQTKLTWQQEVSTALYTWDDAKAYCSSLALDGGGWRMPSLGELQTIVDEGANPSVDASAFPLTPSEYFWSSAAVVGDPARAWTCFFANGSTYSFAVTKPENVRCVK